MGFFNNKDRFELHLDHGKLVLVAIGVLLVGALLFLLGMLVGRSFLSTGADPMARIDAATAGQVVAPPPEPQPTKAKKLKKTEYTFYDNVNKPEGQGPEPLTAKSAAPAEPVAVKKSNVTLIVPRAAKKPDAPSSAAPVEKASKPLLINSAPPAPKAAAPKAVAKKAAAKAAKPVERKAGPLNLATVFTVQVGSFKKRAMAEGVVTRLKSKGITATVRKATIKGGIWFRVQVGEFATKNQARDYYAKRLKPKEIKGFILTR